MSKFPPLRRSWTLFFQVHYLETQGFLCSACAFYNSIGLSALFVKIPSTIRPNVDFPLYAKQAVKEHANRLHT